ncbi:MAG: hypothetical protein M3444_20975 [Acidobacteriota bacterium]|nr:hypothetical protein [Acidobacteriota bacterium]
MKNVLRFLIIAALASAFALPAFAQSTQPTPAAGPCSEAEAQAALYQKFRDNFRGTPDKQKVAYEAGKEYLAKYGNCPDDAAKQITAYVQNWVTKYEAATVEFNCTDAVNKNPKQAYQACEQLRAKNPDDLKVYLMLVAAGVKNYTTGDKSMNAQTVQTARRALDLIGQGKTADSYAPFNNQQEATAGLNYYIGVFTFDTDPDTASAALLKVAQSGSSFGKEPSTFQYLGLAYYNGEFKKLAQEYKDKCEGKEATPECDQLFARVNQVLDRVIDAYARAVALAGNQPKYADISTKVKPALTTLYKQRHDGKEDGLNELIAGVLNKPLPIPGQEPPPTVTPASSSGTTGTDGHSTTNTTGTGTTAKPAATPATNTNTKPASTTTTPAKPATTTPKPPVSKATPAAKSGAATSGH